MEYFDLVFMVFLVDSQKGYDLVESSRSLGGHMVTFGYGTSDNVSTIVTEVDGPPFLIESIFFFDLVGIRVSPV